MKKAIVIGCPGAGKSTFARKLHEGQYRISEEPYIIHPIEVVKILIGLRADKHTLMAGFLHDILEDTETKPEELENLFGADVLNLVQGVTKLSKLQFKSTEERQAENFRRMFIAMANDVRIVFLKLADRLHNMRTLNFMSAAKQQKIPRSEEQGMKYQSLDFPEKISAWRTEAHDGQPSDRTSCAPSYEDRGSGSQPSSGQRAARDQPCTGHGRCRDG